MGKSPFRNTILLLTFTLTLSPRTPHLFLHFCCRMYISFSHSAHCTESQTDGRTDKQTDRQRKRTACSTIDWNRSIL